MEKPETHGDGDQQLTSYRRLLGNARAMLQAAKEERWDDLTALENDRERCLSGVVESDLVSTHPCDIAERIDVIQRILECDEQTTKLIRAWQSEMAEVLGTMDNSRKLANAYKSD